MTPKTPVLLVPPMLAIVACLLQPVAAAARPAAPPWLGSLLFAPKQTVKTNGPAICNCTDTEAELSVCHTEQVTLRVGGDVLSVSTGQSNSSCGSQTVDAGGCLYFRYSFECVYRGLFAGWECHLNSSGLRERAADPETDC